MSNTHYTVDWQPYLLIMNILILVCLTVTGWLSITNGVLFNTFILTTIIMTILLGLFLYKGYRVKKGISAKRGTGRHTLVTVGLFLSIFLFMFILNDNFNLLDYSKQINHNFSEQKSSFENMKISRCDSVGEKEFSCNGTVDIDGVNKEFQYKVVNKKEQLLVSKD